jgi:hypothetical protein
VVFLGRHVKKMDSDQKTFFSDNDDSIQQKILHQSQDIFEFRAR